jgi:hypothetical protein
LHDKIAIQPYNLHKSMECNWICLKRRIPIKSESSF